MEYVSLIVLYDEDKKILIQHRDGNAPSYPLYWSFFGGHLEELENPKEGIIRETYEELEVVLQNPKLFYEEVIELNGIEMHCYYFIEKLKNKNQIVLHEGQGMKWVFPHEIEDMLATPILKDMGPRIEKELQKAN